MKVLLLGYLDNNVGDDLIIEEIVNSFPTISFYIFNKNSQFIETFKELDNLTVVTEDIHSSTLDSFSHCIKVGGSMYIMENKFHYIHRIREIKLARRIDKLKIPSAVVGSNYGPFKNLLGKILVKKELSYKKLITVRDQNSFDQLEKFNFKGKQERKFDDIVYNMKVNDIKKDKKIIGFSIYNSSKIKDKLNYYNNLSKICDQLIEEQSCQIRLFAFDCENENDLVSCFHVKNGAKNSNFIEIIPYLGGNRKQFIESFSECNKMIAMRFHSAILSDKFKIPFLPIVYSNKMENFLLDKKYPYELVKINDLANFDSCKKVVNYLKNTNNLFSNFSEKSDANGHIELLESFFKMGAKDE